MKGADFRICALSIGFIESHVLFAGFGFAPELIVGACGVKKRILFLFGR